MKRLSFTNRRLWLGLGALTLVLALAARLLIAGLLAPAPVLPPLRSADPAIRDTEVKGGVLTIYADVTNAPDAAGNIDKAAGIVLAAGRALKSGVSDPVKGVTGVRFVLRCEAINRFGQDVMAALATLDLPLRALTGADLDRLRPSDVLGLAETVRLGAPGAYDAAAAWCADPARSNAAFCARAKGV